MDFCVKFQNSMTYDIWGLYTVYKLQLTHVAWFRLINKGKHVQDYLDLENESNTYDVMWS